MELFKVSRSKYRRVYGLPTVRGLFLAIILAAALWFSIANDSETERWLFLLMILLVLVHLTESSQPFRHMQIEILAFDPPFAGEIVSIPIRISNQTGVDLDLMSIKLGDRGEWSEVTSIARHSYAITHLPFCFQEGGVHKLPQVVIRTSPTPRFFRYWRILEQTESTFVLPKPIDHQVALKPVSQGEEDAELTDIEQIRDDRLLSLMDQKLFLKTGIPYRRVHKAPKSRERLAFFWSNLENLSHEKKGEQFSFWVQSAGPTELDKKRNMEVSIQTPFLSVIQNTRAVNWRQIKTLFANWFYAQS